MSTQTDRLNTALAGRYEIERELGAGGMATVYLARDLKHDRKVALKVLREDLSASLGKERFLREVKVAAALQHPHILPLYDSGDANGLLFYVMPFVDGQSLREKLVKEGELPIHDAVRILRDVADALSEAHKHGVVHRDLKPENVMIRGRHALVTDFGVAKALSDATGKQSLTTIGVALGTPTYMSPEQATADPHLDHRADIYAFGVLGYELLTGRPPFSGNTPQQTLAAHVTAIPEPVTTHRAAIPPVLAALVMRCLEKKPADRWQHVEELIPPLEALLTPSGGVTPTDTRPVTADSLPIERRNSRRLMAIAIALVVVIASGAIYWRSRLRTGGVTAAARSIAVLPFTSADTASAYLGLGISDAVRSELTTNGHGVRVMSRSSSLSFQGKTVDASEAGQKLKVSTVLDGDIRSEGTRLHITAELVNVADGTQLWSGTFDRERKDIFALQDSIAHAIAGALQVKLLDQWHHSAGESSVGTSNVQAYDLYMRGRLAEDKRGGSSLRAAIVLFQQSIALDPKFARAYAGLGGTLSLLPSYSDVSTDSVSLLGLKAIDRAIALDSTSAEAHAARGSMLNGLYRWNEAESELRHAIQLDPQYGMAYKWLCEELYDVGRAAESIPLCRRATELDADVAVSWANYGVALWATGADSAAHVANARALEIDPGFSLARDGSAAAFAERGKPALALAEILRQPDSGLSASSLGTRAYVFALSGRRSEAQTIVRELQRKAANNGPYLAALANAYVGLGDLDRGLDFFISAARTHDALPPFMPSDDPLRSRPRYAELLRVMNLQDQPIAKWKGASR